MITVGIIANPASGQDIRRLITHASAFGNDEKIRIVRRALIGLESVGVERVWLMPDSFGIGHRALEGLRLGLAASVLAMPTRFDQEDSRRAAALMVAGGARCLITLGGDGTNRAVAKASGATPLMPISTGTNNVFPTMIEATTAGLAAGLAARGLAEAAIAAAPRIEIFRDAAAGDDEAPAADAEPDEIALIDAAVYEETFVGARAIWDGARIRELVLARAEPGAVGLSAIGAHLLGGDLPPGHGLHLRLEPTGQPVTAPIAPGLIQTVYIAARRLLPPGELVTVGCERRWVLALDGERELELAPGAAVRVRLNPHGPRVVDPRRAIAVAARAGVFG
jgi:predicted polyphosphate/ATP-dependent NAD kinase